MRKKFRRLSVLMELELNRETVDQIIFGMENQSQDYRFDIEKGVLVQRDALGPSIQANAGERFVALPSWNSSMGFQLMEKFVANLRNPVYREVLRESLAADKGVFRRFKNALKERSDIERLWFQFKEREMRQQVFDWYEMLRDASALKSMEIDSESADTQDLVLSDFIILSPEADSIESFLSLDRKAFNENFSSLPAAIIDDLYRHARQNIAMTSDSVRCAKTPSGELGGFLWIDEATQEQTADFEGVTYARILQVYVLAEFRGLGLATTLVDTYLKEAYEAGVQWVLVDVYAKVSGFGEKVADYGFDTYLTGYLLDLHKWGLETFYS